MSQPDVYRRPCCDTVGAVDHADWCPEGPDVPVTQPQGKQDWYGVQAMQCIRGLSTRGFSEEHMARVFRAYAAGAPAASRVHQVGQQQ